MCTWPHCDAFDGFLCSVTSVRFEAMFQLTHHVKRGTLKPLPDVPSVQSPDCGETRRLKKKIHFRVNYNSLLFLSSEFIDRLVIYGLCLLFLRLRLSQRTRARRPGSRVCSAGVETPPRGSDTQPRAHGGGSGSCAPSNRQPVPRVQCGGVSDSRGFQTRRQDRPKNENPPSGPQGGITP